MFSSRKLKNNIPPHPVAEAVVGVAGKDRRLVGDDRLQLSEREYMEPAEYDEFNPSALDDGVNTQGKIYPFGQGDFLAKRRRIGNDDGLIANDVAENGIYNHSAVRTFRIDSPKDSLDEVRRLADARRLLTVERVRNENQVDRILNPVLSSEYLVDPLDVRAAYDYRSMQRSRLFDEYNTHNGSGQAFASGCYGKSLDKSKHAIDDDRFLLDDCLQREYNVHDTVKTMVYGDGNLNLGRQAREMIDDHECLMNRKLENRYHLDCGSPGSSSFEHSASLLHKIRKTAGAGRFPISESEPNCDACSVEGFSSEKFSRPLQCGHRIIHDGKHPIVDGRVAESVVESVVCSATSARNAGYVASVDRQVVDDGRFRKSERADNEEDGHTLTNPVMPMDYPSFSRLKQNLSSFSDKLLPEKRRSQFTTSHNFDLSCSKLDDATITRAVPYLPEHPNFSHGCSASMVANRNSSLVRENHPHHGSLGNFYSLSKNRSPPGFLESRTSSRPLDIAPEFVNKGFLSSTSGHQGSLLHESTSSFVNSNFSMHTDLNTSAPVNYRGSLFSKLSPPSTDFENIEGEKGFFAYLSKSRENHFAFDGNLPTASQHVSKHVLQQDMDMLAGKDFICSEAKDFGVGICHPESDLASNGNQYFRFSSNMNLKEPHKISEAPHANSNVNRRSVFTRLTSGEESQFGEERNDSDFNHDCCMDATADEVMEMLKQGDNLSLTKLRKFRVVGLPKHGENAVNKKKTQCPIETNHSTMEKKKLNDASLATADSMDEVPKETRIMDFKRRSDRKKTLVGDSTDSAAHNKITGANEEVKSFMKATLKRKKLVRPVFSKLESATDAIRSIETLVVPAPILDKDDKRCCKTAISICEAEMPNDNTRLSNVLASRAYQHMDCNNKEHPNSEEQKDVVAHVLPSTSHELKGHKKTNMDLQIGSSQVLKETTQHKSFGIQTSVEGILAKDIGATIPDLNVE